MATRTKTPRWTMLALAAALAAFGGVARAGDEGEDAASLVRRARTAADVDRDAPKAITLYRKAIEVGGTGDAARDASLRLARLLEQSGKVPEALEAWKTLSERFGDKLADAEKKEAHEAIGRLLPPGGHARSPLGEVYVKPETAGVSPESPLTSKVVAMIYRYAQSTGDARNTLRSEVWNALRPLGPEAVPALETALRGGDPVQCGLAAELLAGIGGPAGIRALGRAIEAGDAFARAAAVQALSDRRSNEFKDDVYVEIVEGLVARRPDATEAPALRWALAGRLSDEQLLSRADSDPKGRTVWLQVVLSRGSAPAVERVAGMLRSGNPLPKEAIDALGTAAGGTLRGTRSDGRPEVTPRSPTLSQALRMEILRILLEEPITATGLTRIAEAAMVAVAKGSPEEADAAATRAWVRVLTLEDAALRREAARQLLNDQVAVPGALFKDPKGASAYAAALPDLLQPSNMNNGNLVYAEAARGGADFWRVFLPAWGSAGENLSAQIHSWMAERNRPPAAVSAAVGGLLDAVEAGAPFPPAAAKLLGAWLGAVGIAGWGQPAAPNIQTPQYSADATLRRRSIRALAAHVHEQAGSEFQRALAAIAAASVAADGASPARDTVWNAVLAGTDLPSATQLASVAVDYGVLPPASVYAGAEGRTRMAAVFNALQVGRNQAASLTGLLTAGVAAGTSFWDALLQACLDTPEGAVRLLSFLPLRLHSQENAWWPEAAGAAPRDPRWLDVLAAVSRLGEKERTTRGALLLLRFAGETGDARFLEFAKSYAAEKTPTEASIVLSPVLVGYRGPGREAAIREILVAPTTNDTLRVRLCAELVTEGTDADLAILDEAAVQPANPGAPRAVEALARKGDRETVRRAVAAASADPKSPRDYVRSVIEAADRVHLQEALPFLLDKYQAGFEKEAAKALDSIRAYHDRIAAFRSGLLGGSEGRKDLTKLLEDADPEIRRAAVLSLGAMGDKDALPRLVRIAKEEKDPRVRAAALEAVERLARAAPPPPPPPPPPGPRPGGQDVCWRNH